MDIEKIRKEIIDEIDKINDPNRLEEFRLKYLGRKRGKLILILKSLKNLSNDERKKNGFLANELKKELVALINVKKKYIEQNKKIKVDLTKPYKKVYYGELHPLTKIERRIKHIFLSLGFSSVYGPEIETEFNNFDALNIPQNHPAREMWDTLWLKSGYKIDKKYSSDKEKDKKLLLRTHTSPMQIRYMLSHKPPIKIIVPGRVFRNEATDISHEINFYQVEGFMVDKDVSLANFIFIIEKFMKELFKNKKVIIRYRPSYFPFVEPGLEIDIKLGKGDWLEVAGAGMIHPNVFRAVGYNPKDISGFAFGFGLDRLAMIKYDIPDIRLFYSGDLRFTSQPFKQ